MFARPVAEYVKKVLVFCSFVKEHCEHEIADISQTNGLIIFAAGSSKSSLITPFSYTYKLFCDQVKRFFRPPIA